MGTYFEESRETENGAGAERALQQLQRQQGDQVEDERSGLDVVQGQLFGVVDDEALLQVAGAELDDDVDQEDQVGQIVARHPERLGQPLKFGKTLPDDERPQIVEHANRNREQPVKVKVFVRINDRRRLFLSVSPLPPSQLSQSFRLSLRAGAVAIVARV